LFLVAACDDLIAAARTWKMHSFPERSDTLFPRGTSKED